MRLLKLKKIVSLFLLFLLCLMGCDKQEIVVAREDENSMISNVSTDNCRWHVEGKNYRVPCFVDNMIARDCTYEDLLIFLKSDLTDRMISSSDDCLNSCERYSVTLHDNAEAKRIRCGYVIVTFAEIDEIYGRFGHALCAFNTIDNGMVYIDDTLSPMIDIEKNVDFDKIGEVIAGKKYAPKRLFDSIKYKTMGTVESVDIYWSEINE